MEISADIEIWKDVPGYAGLYRASNLGNIKSLSKMIKRGLGNYSRGERVMSPSLSGNGYPEVGLSKDGKCKIMRVHRLIALTWVENPNNYKIINHKDGDKLNNKAANLEWCTSSHNNKHAYDMGLKRVNRAHTEKISEIRRKSAKPIVLYDLENKVAIHYESFRTAAEALGIKKGQLMQAKTKKCITMNKYRVFYKEAFTTGLIIEKK